MVDPCERNEVMVLSVGRPLLGQFDLVGSFQMVDLSDRFLVRRDDVHMFPDLCGISHVSFSSNGWGYETRRLRKGCYLASAGKPRSRSALPPATSAMSFLLTSLTRPRKPTGSGSAMSNG